MSKLTDTQLKAAQPGIHWKTGEPCKDYKIAAGSGLFLLVTTKGGKYWRYKYRVLVGTDWKEKKGSVGTYPDIGLSDARKAHSDALDLLKGGADPVAVKRKATATKAVEREKNRPFPEIAQEWFDDLIAPVYTANNTLRRYKSHLEVLKAGIKPLIADVRKAHLTEVLLPYQNEGKHDTRRRIQVCALDIMEMAHDRGYVEVNHFAGATFKSYTNASATHEPRPAITDPEGFGRLLADIDAYVPDRTAAALRLLALTMLRPGELLQIEWNFINWKECKMVVPFTLLKMRTKRKGSASEGRNLEVPLSRQAIAELRALHKRTGNHKFLFPAMDEDSKVLHMRTYILNRALNRIEYQGLHCPHGFRSSGSTTLNAERRIVGGEEVERWVEQRSLIELQLDHNDASVQAIYDRGGRWKDRCSVMQVWADRIDEMRAAHAAKVLRIAA
jgi:integrase